MTQSDTAFRTLMTHLQADPAALAAFQADPITALHAAGINPPATPIQQAASPRSQPGPMTAESKSCDTHWWGITFVMNEKLTQDIISGATTSGALGALATAALGAADVITGGVAGVIGTAIGSMCAAKATEIKIIDNGNGVEWPISWIQWAALLAAAPMGPLAIFTAGMVFIHPIRN